MVRFVLVLVALVSAPLASAQTTLATWSGGSETFRAQAGVVDRRSSDSQCRTGGECVEFSLSGGRTQQSVLIEQQIAAQGGIYASAWWRFPAGYSWAAGGNDSCEHKMFVINTADSVGRVLVNLRGCDSAPVLQAHIERVGEIEGRGYTNTAWPQDGQWHQLEVAVTSGRLQLWLDGRAIADQPRPTGNMTYTSVQAGAYVNQGANVNRKFKVDDIVIATARGGSNTPPPVNPPAGPDLVRVREELATAAEALARASDLLEQ